MPAMKGTGFSSPREALSSPMFHCLCVFLCIKLSMAMLFLVYNSNKTMFISYKTVKYGNQCKNFSHFHSRLISWEMKYSEIFCLDKKKNS